MKRALRKAAVLGLTTCLALTSLAGCSKEKKFDAEATAITVNDDTLSAGLVKFVSHYMQAYTESFYNAYFGTSSINMAMDQSGTTLGDTILDTNITQLKQMLLAEQNKGTYNVEITDEEKADIEAAAAAFIADNDEEVLTKMSATQEIVERYLELCVIQTRVEQAIEAEVDTEVSDAESTQRKIQYAYFEAETEESTEASTEEAETETEDEAAAMEAAYAKAEAMIEQVKAGEEFEAALQAVMEDDTATASEMTFGVEEMDVDVDVLTVTSGLEDNTLVETPVEVDGGYYVVKLVTQLDREATDARKLEVIEERKTELLNSKYTEWEEAAEISQDDDVLATIVFDFSLTQAVEASTEATTEAETETETAAEEVTEAETATEAETETEAVTEAETETEAAATEAETESETEA